MGIDARIDKEITAWGDIAVKITSAHTVRFLYFGTRVGHFRWSFSLKWYQTTEES